MKKISYLQTQDDSQSLKRWTHERICKVTCTWCKYTSQGLTPLQGHLHLGLIFLLFHGVWSLYGGRRERWRGVGMWRVFILRGPGRRAQDLPSITQSHTWSPTPLGTSSYFTIQQNFSSTKSSRALEAGSSTEWLMQCLVTSLTWRCCPGF